MPLMLEQAEKIISICRLTQNKKEDFFCLFLAKLGFTNIKLLAANDKEINATATIELGILSHHFLIKFVFDTNLIDKNTLMKLRNSAEGHINKGMIITVGYFSREAKKHRWKRGNITIDLVDADALLQKLKIVNIEYVL
jgi:hypothetical protein